MPAYRGGGGGGGASAALPAPLAAVERVLEHLQRVVESEYPRLSCCSREFLEFLDRLEEEATRRLEEAGFKKVRMPSSRERNDLPIGFYAAGGMLVELGLRGLNRCGRLSQLTGGRPPRVYARVYIGGRAAYVLEARGGGEEKGEGLTFI